ncbi:MAG: UDP-N-acetylglucosamine 2-epimerase [Gammaproteobacteria bacterium]
MVRKICVVITARPSYSRVRTVLEAMSAHTGVELQLVVAASALLRRYGDTESTIEQEGFHIDRRVYMVMEGENLVTSAKSTGLGLSELATVFNDLRPDVVVTVADRFETMATAVAASYLNLPLAHIQGGEVTGSIDEKVRHAITKLADLHFVASSKAAERVIKMGERPASVFITGCPSIDVVKAALDNNDGDFDVFTRYAGVGPIFDLSNGYIVVMQHPVTTEYDESRQHVESTLQAVSDIDVPTLWFWPNVDAGADGVSEGIRAFREIYAPKNIHFFKSTGPEDFIHILNRSDCIVGNSSAGIRECAYLGLPTVNIGSRQTGRDRGRNITDVDYDRDEIREAIVACRNQGRIEPDFLYGDGGAGQRIAELLAEVPLTIEKRLAY